MAPEIHVHSADEIQITHEQTRCAGWTKLKIIFEGTVVLDVVVFGKESKPPQIREIP